MNKTRRKCVNDFRAWTGVDVSMDISLHDYGLAWKLKDKKREEYVFVYGMSDGERYTRFHYAYMTKKDFEEAFWFDGTENKAKIEQFTGQTVEELVGNFPRSVDEILSYYGSLEVFGDAYCEGFEIL